MSIPIPYSNLSSQSTEDVSDSHVVYVVDRYVVDRYVVDRYVVYISI